MSKLLVQEMRRASGAAIAELGLPTATTRSLTSAIDIMSGEELRGDLLPRISERPTESAAALGRIVGSVLTHPHLKLPGNKFDSSQNRQLVREVAAKIVDPGRQLEISIGIGGSEDAPSLRFPAYVSPALDIARAFMRSEVEPPTVRVFNAHEVSSSINGLDAGLAVTRAGQAVNLVQLFTDRFYSDVAPSLRQDMISFADIKAKGFADDVRELLNALHADPAELTPDMQSLQQQLEKLRRASAKHAGHRVEEAELIMCGYAAAHGITFHNYANPNVDGVIKLGGQGEAPFDVIQQQMTNRHSVLGKTAVSNLNAAGKPQLINLRMKAGVLPPYYLERLRPDGDSPELSTATPVQAIPKTIEAITAHYQAYGLRSGSDFTHLHPRVQTDLPQLLHDCVETCKPDELPAGQTYGIMEIR